MQKEQTPFEILDLGFASVETRGPSAGVGEIGGRNKLAGIVDDD